MTGEELTESVERIQPRFEWSVIRWDAELGRQDWSDDADA